MMESMDSTHAHTFSFNELRAIASETVTLTAARIRDKRADLGDMWAYTNTKSSAVDPVTIVDTLAEDFIANRLQELRPEDGLIGEEGTGTPSLSGVTWIVDPIDGTSNFVHGVAFFCISIAAAVDGQLLAAVVLDPISGEEFTANSTAAFLNERRLEPSARPEQSRANLMTDYPGAESMLKDGELSMKIFGQWIQDFATVRRKVCAALALAHVAAGWCDASIGFDTKVWDVAAGAHLIRMAKGTFRGLSYGQPGLADHQCPGFIAQGPGANYPSLAAAAEQIHQLRASI